MTDSPTARDVAERLAALYDRNFAGKERGRYRISMKHMRMLAGRRRVPPGLIHGIGEELFEMGYILIDMEAFFVVLAQATFRSYRRVNDGCVTALAESRGQP